MRMASLRRCERREGVRRLRELIGRFHGDARPVRRVGRRAAPGSGVSARARVRYSDS
jgi:hypothetical protein